MQLLLKLMMISFIFWIRPRVCVWKGLWGMPMALGASGSIFLAVSLARLCSIPAQVGPLQQALLHNSKRLLSLVPTWHLHSRTFALAFGQLRESDIPGFATIPIVCQYCSISWIRLRALCSVERLDLNRFYLLEVFYSVLEKHCVI